VAMKRTKNVRFPNLTETRNEKGSEAKRGGGGVVELRSGGGAWMLGAFVYSLLKSKILPDYKRHSAKKRKTVSS